MKCVQVTPLLSGYLDGAVTGKEMRALYQHLGNCDLCRRKFAGLRHTQLLLAKFARPKAPGDLSLKLRLAISREAARPRHPYLEHLGVHIENTLQVFTV